MEILDIMIYLAKRGALSRPVALTTSNVGKDIGISQQSVSRWLIALDRRGYTQRSKGIKGYIVRITPAGKMFMLDLRNRLTQALSEENKLLINGRLVTGIGDGRYYMGLEQYRKSIRDMLGFTPYAGTLNLRLKNSEEHQYKERLAACSGVEIASFKVNRRTFGSIKCFPCTVSGAHAVVILPERSHYGNDTLELISQYNLREKLKVSDGDDLRVLVRIK